MQSKKRVTAAEFEAIKPLLGISEDRIAAARAAVVDGQTLKSIGDGMGCSKQNVATAVNAVMRALERYREAQAVAAKAGLLLPPGWERVTLIAPSFLIAKFRAEIATAAPRVVHKTRKKAS